MSPVFVVADNIVSPLGADTVENFARLRSGETGVGVRRDEALSPEPFCAAMFGPEAESMPGSRVGGGAVGKQGSRVGAEAIGMPGIGADYTPFESLLIASIRDALGRCGVVPSDPNTLLILSTTKGNIGLIENHPYDGILKERVSLHHSGRLVAEHFGFVRPPLIVSNACISGIVAIITGMRLIRARRYRHVVVAGADLIGRFILSGFQAFQAVSVDPCRPFDRDRRGINLGEGAATMVLSADRDMAANGQAGAESPYAASSGGIVVSGGMVTNDANHLSAPSRTGEELAFAIVGSLEQAGLDAGDIGFVSAHGTATSYNDEMEAKAITLAGLGAVPVNSLKGFYGHTLGAAGLIETVVSIRSMHEGLILPTRGFAELGVSRPLNICRELLQSSLRHVVKTASGFGGCNAALALSKE